MKWPFVAVSGVSMLVLFFRARPTQQRLGGLGVANAVTLLRLSITLIGSVLFPTAAMFGLVLALDGVDGLLARRLGETSPFGALFDMETDGVFMSLLALTLAPEAPWVLAVAGWRPVFVLVRLGFPNSSHGEPRTWVGRGAFTVAAWLMVFACATRAAGWTPTLTVISTAAISASFLVSLSELRR